MLSQKGEVDVKYSMMNYYIRGCVFLFDGNVSFEYPKGHFSLHLKIKIRIQNFRMTAGITGNLFICSLNRSSFGNN